MSTAISRVLSTPELLEFILAHLPTASLLQAQLISRNVQILIRTSPALQQLLFLRPSQPSTEWRLNPLLRQHFPPFFFIDNLDLECGSTRSSFGFVKWMHSESSRCIFLRKEATWRNMLVVQPPHATLLVSRGTYHVDPETGSHRSLDGTYLEEGEEVAAMSSEHGVTMGQIYDIVVSFLIKAPGGVFSLAFESRPDGVRIMLRLYALYGFEEDDGELYESEGLEIGVDDLAWARVKQDWLDDEHKLSEMFTTWGCDLTKDKGGMLETDWYKERHSARIREFMAR